MKDFEHFGIFMCCSGIGVVRVERVKDLILKMEKMGYNLLELGLDDVFKIEEEPYFGYLRGGYTESDLKEMDRFARDHGVELVPCVQTLGHLTNLLKLPAYSSIVDIGNVLLIDEPRTYELIDRMFCVLSRCFTSRLINIGMDEAHYFGRGKYLDKNGYVNAVDLLVKHLERVIGIAKKYGFSAHMWSDMFFRINNHGKYYEKGARIDESIKRKLPRDISLCYWDYGEHELTEEMFGDLFFQHEELGRELWFAGGAWNWNGFAPQNTMSLKAMELAIKQACRHSVKHVLIALWSDDGNECPFDAVLPSLYAIRQYARGVYDEERISKGFYEMFGVKFEDFMLLDLPNKTKRNSDLTIKESACKTLLYNDCFLGWKDSAMEKEGYIPYKQYTRVLKEAAKRLGEYADIAENLANLCSVLELKSTLGVRTRSAYRCGDKKTLLSVWKDYRTVADGVKKFHIGFKKLWHKYFRPFGWAVHEIRLGGLESRIEDCAERLKAYLDGSIERIEELEETILPYADWGLQYNLYRGIVTVSEL